MRRLVVGCGYLGSRVARAWVARGDLVHVVTRSGERAEQLRSLGMVPLVGDVTRPRTLPALPAVQTLLWAVGYDRTAGMDIHQVYVDGVRNLLSVLLQDVARIVYISSTGVFGQTNGEWVDEFSPCRPRRAGGEACLCAEQLWLNSRWSDRLVILRLAGIYGPQRLPRVRQLRAAQPLSACPDEMLNLIHVDDAAEVVERVAEASMDLPRTFIVADTQPVTRREFYQELASRLGTPPPTFDPSAAGASRGGRGGGHKRVSSRRLREELGVQFRYPSYREGLAAIAHASWDPDSPSCDRQPL
jgi:nucleoside-diphosphate-sugar epimerase